MEKPAGTHKKIGGYYFYLKGDRSMWVLRISSTRRIMSNGNPYVDKKFTEWLDRLEKGKVSKILLPLMKRYKIRGGVPVLMDCSENGFKLVKNEIQHDIDEMTSYVDRLIEIYCSKNKDRNYEEVAEIQDFFRRVV